MRRDFDKRVFVVSAMKCLLCTAGHRIEHDGEFVFYCAKNCLRSRCMGGVRCVPSMRNANCVRSRLSCYGMTRQDWCRHDRRSRMSRLAVRCRQDMHAFATICIDIAVRCGRRIDRAGALSEKCVQREMRSVRDAFGERCVRRHDHRNAARTLMCRSRSGRPPSERAPGCDLHAVRITSSR